MSLVWMLASALSAAAPQWVEADTLLLEGRGWTDVASPYDRLPARAEKLVRPDVWNLSHNSAGLCVRFVTTARSLRCQWALRSANLDMPHMPATGVSGVDLYARLAGGWRFVANGRPTAQTNEAEFGLPAGASEYRLYLPLYNGVSSVKLAVPEGQTLTAATPSTTKPVVVYGTSIVQGGCASRPGLASVALAGRLLDVPTINLGFSGNAKSEPEVADLLAELDPSVFVLDPLWNMTPDEVSGRIAPLVRRLRTARPTTPILLVEDSQVFNQVPTGKGKLLRGIYDALRAEGVGGLSFLSADGMLGTDGEGTVDGCHPNDLGFERQAQAYVGALKPLLGATR